MEMSGALICFGQLVGLLAVLHCIFLRLKKWQKQEALLEVKHHKHWTELWVYWVNKLSKTRLDDTSCEALNAELSSDKILDFIKSLQNSPDDFSIEF